MTTASLTKPKVLYVAAGLPCPPSQGSHLRILNTVRQIRKVASVTFVCVGPEPDSRALEETRKEFGDVIIMPTINRRLPAALEKMRHRYRFHWPWYHGEKVSHADRQRFVRLRDSHDLTWFHTVLPADSLTQYRFGNSIVDLDDLNQVKFALKYKTETSPRGRIADKILTYKWRRWESKAFKRFDYIAVCSEDDKEFLGGGDRIEVIPNGFERPLQNPVWHPRNYRRIGFIGLLGYGPNMHGMKWFAEEVWPRIKTEVPDAEVRIVGRPDKTADLSAYENFKHLGFLEKTDDEFATWSLMVVPLCFGGGTRLKIIEAFSKMCPVVSTSIGAHGLNVSDDRNIKIRDSAQDFAQACIMLLNEPDHARQLAEQAWQLYENKYTWQVIGQDIHKFIAKALGPEQHRFTT